MRWLIASIVVFTSSICAGAERDDSRAARRSPVVQVFESCRDAVVNISSKEIITVRDPFGFDSIFDDFFNSGSPFRGPGPGPGNGGGGGERQYTRTSVGSGFVIHPDGYIVTNAHVVAQTAERKAIFPDGREFDAQIIAFDTQRDLAVLKIESDKSLPAIKLGRSNDLMIGETVIAVGNPLGFQNTVTAGVISATDRQLDFGHGTKLAGLIQTDASINPGNSGGPLLNVLGELIGINSAIRGDAQNIGFAIPVDQLREVLPDLLDIERRYRVVCGLTVDTLDSPKVTAVQPGSPAEKAGIKIGDVVSRTDDHSIKEGIDFSIAMIGCHPGQKIDMQLQRNGKPIQASFTLDARPAPNGVQLALDKLGMEVSELPAERAQQLGLPGVRGLLVSRIESGGPADQTGIVRRDVLLAIGRHAVTTPEDLGELLEKVQPGESVPVSILRVDQHAKIKYSGELKAR